MKLRCVIPLLTLAVAVHAEDVESARASAISPLPVPPTPPSPVAPTSWLGVDLSKPDPSLAAQLPALPAGVGFLVKSLHTNGPAANAGILKADLIWKLNDQLLVNEAQLSTLLRMHPPNEEVLFAVFRGGSLLEIPVVLGTSPMPAAKFAGQAAEEALFLSEQGPMRVVNLAAQEAYISNSDGRATVRKMADGYWLTIQNSEGAVVFDGGFDRALSKHDNADAIPNEWKRRVYSLRRGLDHALEGRMVPQRRPRPRVVPPSPRPDHPKP